TKDVKLSESSLCIIIVSVLLFLILFTFLLHRIQTWRLKKDEFWYTNEELERINREVMNGPKFQNVLITHDIIAYHSWMGVRLISVRNIIWIKEDTVMYPLFSPLGMSVWSKKCLIIQEGYRSCYIPMEDIDENAVQYLINIVKEVRPGVIIAKEEDKMSDLDDNRKKIEEWVYDAGTMDAGKLEMMYTQNGLYPASPKEHLADHKIETKLLLFTAVMYLIAYPLCCYSHYFIRHSDPIKQELINRIWITFGGGFFAVVPLIIYVIYFFRHLFLDKKRPVSKKYKTKYTAFALIPILAVIFFYCFQAVYVKGFEAVRGWKEYKEGMLDTEAYAQSIIISTYSEKEDQWRYEDQIYPMHREVYGYDRLTKKEQMVFDLLYSEIMAKEVIPINLPEEGFTDQDFRKVMELYECNRQFDSLRKYKYKGTRPTRVSEVCVEKITKRLGSEYEYTYHKTVEEIVNMIPADMDNSQKLKWIADYLLKNVEISQIQDRGDGRKIEEMDDNELDSDKLSTMGYGALILHSATEKGYMEAFGLIAEKAGIYMIAAMDDESHHYWNLVQVDGQWKAINLYKTDQYPDQKESYYLVDNGKMEKLLNAKGTYGGCNWIELP
ncbi:MAG: hypothetical protein K2K70_07495, partial [Lachnospiraceae bacterium]|nr:hypothetical protein [Lachnospiraceae bacterium]